MHTHTLTHIHACTHTHASTRVHAHVCKDTHLRTHIHIYTHVHSCTYTLIYARTCTYADISIRMSSLTCSHMHRSLCALLLINCYHVIIFDGVFRQTLLVWKAAYLPAVTLCNYRIFGVFLLVWKPRWSCLWLSPPDAWNWSCGPGGYEKWEWDISLFQMELKVVDGLGNFCMLCSISDRRSCRFLITFLLVHPNFRNVYFNMGETPSLSVLQMSSSY